MATESASGSSDARENDLLSFSNPNYQLGDAVNCNTAGTTTSATTATTTTTTNADQDDPYDDLYQKLDSVCNFKQPSAVKNRRNYAALDINSMGIDLNNVNNVTDTSSALNATAAADANRNTELNSMTMSTTTHRHQQQSAAGQCDATDNEKVNNLLSTDRSGSDFFNYLICADGGDWIDRQGSKSRPDLIEDARLRRSSIDSTDGHLPALKLPVDGSPGDYSNGNGSGNGSGDGSSCMELNSPDDEGGVMCGSVTVETSEEIDEIPHVPGQLNDDLYAVLVKRRVGCKPTTPAEDAKDEDTSLAAGVTEGGGEMLEPLPPGWERHEDNDGPYYWHIKSGTIQREVPPPPPLTPNSIEAKPIAMQSETENDALVAGHVAVPDTMCISTAHVISLPQIESKDKRKGFPRVEDDNKDKPIRFAVRSLGWVEIAEEDLTPERSSKAVNKCIVDLSLGRNDILDVVGRWGDGKDLFMDLDNSSLKLIDPENLTVLNTQPIHTIRVWGVGRDNGRDFAYVARDRASRKHMCHVFRCDTPARTIANTLRDICKRIMIERSQGLNQQTMLCGGRSMADQAQQTRTQLSTSTSSSSSLCSSGGSNGSSSSAAGSRAAAAAAAAAGGGGGVGGLVRPTNLPTEQRRFQSRGTVTTYSAQSFPTPMEEPKKVLKVHYLGMTHVNKPTGMDVLNAAVEQMNATVPVDKWHFVNVAIAPSTITISEPGEEGKLLVECRVRFLSFLGIGRNVKHCGFIMHTAQDEFVAHIFHCEPSSGALCKTIEAACKLRYQKCLDAHPAGSEKRLSDSQNVRGLGATIKNVLGTLSGKRSKSTDS